MSKRILFSFVIALLGFFSVAQANENLIGPKMDPTNYSSLQRGAKYFVNYCSGCHSLKYMRFNRMAKDIGITEDDGKIAEAILKKDLIFTGVKVGDTLQTAMTEEEGKKWFGVAPPDLSLETRSRGSAWVYHYLHSFYVDPSKDIGSNNLVFPDVAMPNVLGELQGQQKVHLSAEEGDSTQNGLTGTLELVSPGKLTPAQFDAVVYDITNFLTYVGDPIKVERYRLGVWALLFLVLLTTVLYLLKREYWKDIH